MGLIQKIKSMFSSGGQNRKAAPTTPSNMLATRHKPYAAQAGLSGNRARHIAFIRNNRERTIKLPYQPEIVEACKEKLKMPVFPEDGNDDNPNYDVLDQYDPGNIKWDN